MAFYCFQDTEEMQPGLNAIDVIFEGIDRCANFVPMITNTYGGTKWPAVEVSYFSLNVSIFIFIE